MNLVASIILAGFIYFRRHRRRDLFVGLMAFNLALFTVAESLAASSSITVGVGFGLFAVLSIVRLRSDESSQIEIGYTMVSLALGLLNGLPDLPFQYKLLFSTVLVVGMFIFDHPLVIRTQAHERFKMRIDYFSNRQEDLVAYVEANTGMRVTKVSVLDYRVRNGRPQTLIDVRAVRDPDQKAFELERKKPMVTSDSRDTP